MIIEKEMQPLVKMLARDEGYEQFAYDDATGKQVFAPLGKLTIGIGINLQDTGIDYEEALYLLINRIKKFDKLLGSLTFYESLDIVRRYVLINMTFNLGFTGLLSFRKFLGAIESKDYERAQGELLNSKAYRQLPARYGRLAEMILTGKMI